METFKKEIRQKFSLIPKRINGKWKWRYTVELVYELRTTVLGYDGFGAAFGPKWFVVRKRIMPG